MGATAVPATARAASPLAWSAPVSVDPGPTPSAIACPSEGLCVAVDRAGNVLHSSDPAASSPSWSKAQIDSGHALTSLACASASLCVAVDESGRALSSTNPTGGASAWTPTGIDGTGLTGVSCPSATMCVAVDQAGSALASADPGAPSPAWTKREVDKGNRLNGVSCPSEALCVAVDAAGNAPVSIDPGAPSPTWTKRAIDPAGEPRAVSCASDGLCVAIDGAGDTLASADPGAANPTWSSTEIDLTGVPAGISCATSGLCVLLDDHGSALASDNPTAALPTWSGSTADPGTPMAGISCLPAGMCVAIDTAGRIVRALVPAPISTTTAAVEVGAGEATLTATVDPSDAALGECRFEYGPTAAYGQSASCAGPPSPTGGAQLVKARITGLAPASTYHFRIVAANAGGTSAGADRTLTTAPPISIVHPHPSIAGVPGVGERLRCSSGVPSGATATLTYAWVRDSSAIAGAGTSSYLVSRADAMHHLQCRVTATDAAGSATAGSEFVAIPAAGVLAAAGETRVGKVLAHGTSLSVPVSCSSRAPGGCAIALRVTTRQTRSGKPVRRVTLTLATTSAHLKQSEQRTILLKLGAAARRLLARAHSLTVTVSVSGTVIGALKASLATATLVLRTPTRHAH
ncbi:MAG TPA: hypothetical protein VES65_01040 [Solirubrobacteraceae bacterium]|nr:hypothetical protein [Solirubrobacteraceae bacterium]